MKSVKNFFSNTKEGLFILFYALKDKRTPVYAKIFIILAAVYLVSPVDMLPDTFLPFGLLDDLAIVPSVLYFVYKNLPESVLLSAREKSATTGKTVDRGILALFFAAAAAIILFLILLYLFYKLIF